MAEHKDIYRQEKKEKRAVVCEDCGEGVCSGICFLLNFYGILA